MTKIIKTSEFKAKCLALLDEVQSTGQTLTITKHGRVVAELGPPRARKKSLSGTWKGKVFITGDIMSPIDVEWEALK
jgi:prevent-host-death family protein